MAETSILVMRHFATPYNEGVGGMEESRSHSRIGIDRAAAEPLAERNARVLDAHDVSVITSSDLPRGKQSAQLLARKMDNQPEVVVTRAGETWNTGQAGQPEKKAIEQRKKYARHPDEPMPDGESLNEFRDRFVAFVHGEFAKKKAYPGRERAMVLHGHQIIFAEPFLNGEDVKDKHWDGLERIKPADLLKLTEGADGRFRMEPLEKQDGEPSPGKGGSQKGEDEHGYTSTAGTTQQRA